MTMRRCPRAKVRAAFSLLLTLNPSCNNVYVMLREVLVVRQLWEREGSRVQLEKDSSESGEKFQNFGSEDGHNSTQISTLTCSKIAANCPVSNNAAFGMFPLLSPH